MAEIAKCDSCGTEQTVIRHRLVIPCPNCNTPMRFEDERVEQAVLAERERAARVIEELSKDRDRLDACADLRIVDGIGEIDIDEWTADRMTTDSEEEWKLRWREGLRYAIDAYIAAERVKEENRGSK